MIVDGKGVGREKQKTITMINDPPKAYPSVIPGPSELPLLYDNGTVYAQTSGLAGVRPGEKVQLRGWGEDRNLPSPEQFNPDAPLFDIYGSKNGNWRQSAFSFSWKLFDKGGADISALLDNASRQNTFFTVPPDARSGDTYTARLTVTGDAGLPEIPPMLSSMWPKRSGASNARPATAIPIAAIRAQPMRPWASGVKTATVPAVSTTATKAAYR